MLTQIVKIQNKGLITIPKNMRDELGLKDLVQIKQEKDRLILKPVSVLPYPVRHYTKKDVQEFLAADQKDEL